MIAKRQFSLGAILAVSHDVLMCEWRELYEILNFMTRDKLYMHQLPRVAGECQPWIFRQHPQLKSIKRADVSCTNKDNMKEKLLVLQNIYGESLEIEQIPMDDHDIKDPIEELKEIRGDKPTIIIDNTDGKLSEDDIKRLVKEKLKMIMDKEKEQKDGGK